jgi:hypothetical protein
MKMDEKKIQMLLESIKVLNTLDDFELREVIKKSLANELGLSEEVLK